MFEFTFFFSLCVCVFWFCFGGVSFQPCEQSSKQQTTVFLCIPGELWAQSVRQRWSCKIPKPEWRLQGQLREKGFPVAVLQAVPMWCSSESPRRIWAFGRSSAWFGSLYGRDSVRPNHFLPLWKRRKTKEAPYCCGVKSRKGKSLCKLFWMSHVHNLPHSHGILAWKMRESQKRKKSLKPLLSKKRRNSLLGRCLCPLSSEVIHSS